MSSHWKVTNATFFFFFLNDFSSPISFAKAWLDSTRKPEQRCAVQGLTGYDEGLKSYGGLPSETLQAHKRRDGLTEKKPAIAIYYSTENGVCEGIAHRSCALLFGRS
jgi:hypothetical protein